MPTIGRSSSSQQAQDAAEISAANQDEVVVSSVLGRSLGPGFELFNGSNGTTNVTLDFKTIVAGAGISISANANSLTITGTGASVDLSEIQATLDQHTSQLVVVDNTLTTYGTLISEAQDDITALSTSMTSQFATVNSSISSLNASVIGKVSKSGDTMTGALTLYGNPTQSLQAATKAYVDAETSRATSIEGVLTTSVAGKVSRTGDTMTGYLVLHADPTANMHPATKSYVDTRVAANNLININTQTGTTVSYQIQASDAASTFVRIDSVNPGTVLVPDDTTLNLDVGTNILIGWVGDGQVSVAGLNGNVTINTPDTLKIARKHGKLTLIKVAANMWDIEGNLEPAA